MALALTLLTLRSLLLVETVTLEQSIFFFIFCAGHFFLLASLVQFVLCFPLGILLNKKSFLGICILSNTALASLVLADSFVFQQYRFHINAAVLDLFINGGSEVIHFSLSMWLNICGLVLILFLVVLLCVWGACRVAKQNCRLGWVIVAFLLSFCAVNVYHAYAFAGGNTKITSVVEAVPWARPVTMSTFFKKIGLAVERTNRVSLSGKGFINYPLSPLTFGNAKPLNIVFIVVDALRADMLNVENMPFAWSIAQKSLHFTNHYSSGNATRAGIFGLFYGLPPTYWHSVLNSQIPSALITALLHQGYAIEAFAGAKLTSPEFDKTVFSNVPNVRLHSIGETSWARDLNCVKDFKDWLPEVKQPFFSFIFFDNVHAYSLNPNKSPKFKPHWTTANNLKLNNELDPTEYFNLYKNAVLDADSNIEKVWRILKEQGMLDNTIVVISSDHGEEFNDNKLNYWGHNGNFTDAQIKIPLVIYWPGKDMPRQYSHLTTSYDLTATLMPEVLGVKNPIKDYSVGSTLWEEKEQDWFISGSYQNTAVIEPNRIVLVNAAGLLLFKDRQYNETSADSRSKTLIEAINLMGRYKGSN